MNTDAEALVERVKKRYASCRSYVDHGQLTSVLPNDTGSAAIYYQTFSTAFVRPDKFRFEFRDRFPERQFGRYVVWREGASVKTWWYQHNPKVKVSEDLSLGLAGATGVSHGVAVSIPNLLLPDEVSARGLFEEVDAEILGREECQDRDCFKIHTTGSGQHILWIEENSGLIIRIEERRQIGYHTSGFVHKMLVGKGNLTSQTIITYRPQFDVEILPAQLEFGEPFGGYGDDVELLNPYS